jgi:hypothetical protein
MSKDIVLKMNVYGINTLVKTTQERIDFYLNLFETEDDAMIGGGVGKKMYGHLLIQELRMLDQQFDQSPVLRMVMPQLWDDFIEDCVIFAALDHFSTGRALPIGRDYALYEQMEEIESAMGAPGIIHTVK